MSRCLLQSLCGPSYSKARNPLSCIRHLPKLLLSAWSYNLQQLLERHALLLQLSCLQMNPSGCMMMHVWLEACSCGCKKHGAQKCHAEQETAALRCPSSGQWSQAEPVRWQWPPESMLPKVFEKQEPQQYAALQPARIDACVEHGIHLCEAASYLKVSW